MRTSAIPPRHPTAAAIARLTGMLRLPAYGQDWEIEVADPGRVAEFLDVYEGQPLDEDERFTLMELIVGSFDELLAEGHGPGGQWRRIRPHLLERFDLHGYTVQYWSLPDAEDAAAAQDGFEFTPLARELMMAVYGPRERWPRPPVLVKRFIDRPEPVLPGVPLNVLHISDNRDGTGYTLWWCTYGERTAGERVFPSVDEAVRYAAEAFGVAPHRWQNM